MRVVHKNSPQGTRAEDAKGHKGRGPERGSACGFRYPIGCLAAGADQTRVILVSPISNSGFVSHHHHYPPIDEFYILTSSKRWCCWCTCETEQLTLQGVPLLSLSSSKRPYPPTCAACANPVTRLLIRADPAAPFPTLYLFCYDETRLLAGF